MEVEHDDEFAYDCEEVEIVYEGVKMCVCEVSKLFVYRFLIYGCTRHPVMDQRGVPGQLEVLEGGMRGILDGQS